MSRRKTLSPERVLEELVTIGFARVTDFLYVEDGQMKLKPIKGQSGAAIASVEETSKGMKIKLCDKMKALELLGKHMGMYDGSGKQQAKDNNLLTAILKATEQEVDITDIPELQQTAAAGDELVEPSGTEKL